MIHEKNILFSVSSYSELPFSLFQLHRDGTSVTIANVKIVLTRNWPPGSCRYSLTQSCIPAAYLVPGSIQMFVEFIELLPFPPRFPPDVGPVKFLNSGFHKKLRAKVLTSSRAPIYCTNISRISLLSRKSQK